MVNIIEKYRNKKSLTWRAFGLQCGLSASMLLRLKNGERFKNVSFGVMQKIVNGTKGEISFDQLCEYFRKLKETQEG